MLHTGLLKDVDPLSIAFCRSFDGSPENIADLAWAIIEEHHFVCMRGEFVVEKGGC